MFKENGYLLTDNIYSVLDDGALSLQRAGEVWRRDICEDKEFCGIRKAVPRRRRTRSRMNAQRVQAIWSKETNLYGGALGSVGTV